MKKILLHLLVSVICLLIIASFSLISCREEAASTEKEAVEEVAPIEEEALDETTEESQEKKFDGVTIELVHYLSPYGDSAGEKGFGEVVNSFTRETGINVQVTQIPWNETTSQLILSVQSGTSPDASIIRHEDFGQLVASDSLMQLDSYIDNDFDEAVKEDFLLYDKLGFANGKKYTLPWGFNGLGLFARKDLLDEAGLEFPKTWEEFIDVGIALKSPEVTSYLFGFSIAQPNQIIYLKAIIEGMGGKILDDDGKAAFDSQAGIETVEFFKSLVWEHEIMPKAAISTKWMDVFDAFKSGRLAMALLGTSQYNDCVETLGADNVEVGRIPSSPTVIYSWQLAIPKGAKNPDAAWEFLKYFNSPEAQLTFSKLSGLIPTRQSASEDPFFSESSQGKITSFWVDYIATNGSVQVSPVKYNELTEIYVLAIQDALGSSDSNVKELLETAANEFNDIVESE